MATDVAAAADKAESSAKGRAGTGWLPRPKRERRRGREAFLGQRQVYILPTGPGLGFAALLLVLLVGSINYNWASASA
ncbi:hypothetical protein [Massilia sp. Dwa41.01b]|uniref:hypothetical protein n=1 Tax=Massilia sp. Dwa41.01b TaxID=2709302 RepID=UPI001E429FCD|nr:hypothetical protein [Massilia sp. Dwa41.01b]